MLPFTTLIIAMGVYMRTSEFEHEQAAFHLIAMAGCKAAEAIVPGPFLVGQPGYHARNDPDGDGVACGTIRAAPVPAAVPQQGGASQQRSVGNAKFVRP
ncbi:excalibur calcium-binding domain-containing protein [Ruegeria halocynthiae]|uniref:excalibur calcium-binding domain-containing protein n=1 Tax=Ruegeria halocynthiae TaxID=985054 RepID=UPI000A4B1A39|nr:excalibur calcium-binding domain-containing protein [Ruegeria halocynthiae]